MDRPTQPPANPRSMIRPQGSPRTLASLGRNQSYGKPGRGPNVFYQHVPPPLPRRTLLPPPAQSWVAAPPLPHRLAVLSGASTAQGSNDGRLPASRRNHPYVLPPPRIDHSQISEFHRRQARHCGTENVDVSPTRPSWLGRSYSNPLPLVDNSCPVLLRAAASLGGIPLHRVSASQPTCMYQLYP